LAVGKDWAGGAWEVLTPCWDMAEAVNGCTCGDGPTQLEAVVVLGKVCVNGVYDGELAPKDGGWGDDDLKIPLRRRRKSLRYPQRLLSGSGSMLIACRRQLSPACVLMHEDLHLTFRR
jgi:hypothetical protein